jgi:hypothetical protein
MTFDQGADINGRKSKCRHAQARSKLGTYRPVLKGVGRAQKSAKAGKRFMPKEFRQGHH